MEIYFSLPANGPYFQANFRQESEFIATYQLLSWFSTFGRKSTFVRFNDRDRVILKNVVKGFAERPQCCQSYHEKKKKSINLVVPKSCFPATFNKEPNADQTKFTP